MSRVAKKPIDIPKGVEVSIRDNVVHVKGPKGALTQEVHPQVELTQEDAQLKVAPRKPDSMAIAGTMQALVANMCKGVSEGFERKLQLVGVGYRAQAKGKSLNIAVGFSHPVDFPVPEGLTIETPSQTEIVIKGADKQQVGQAAANIRAYRPPEPYKGKGIRYADEYVAIKEAKKK
ncbi:MAG: 50S ribosomal protein L6 [Pseudomonadota bacterium]